jgi:hypothetical protein
LKAEDIKREYDRARLIDLAKREGLETAPGRIQCPHRCCEERRGCSVGDTGNGAMWHCKRCSQGGSAIDLVMATRNFNEREAVEFLSGQLGTLPPPAAPKAAVDVKWLWRSLSAADEAGLEYLKTRALERSAEMGLVRFNVGGIGHNPRCRKPCASCWLDDKASQGMRIAVPLYGIDGAISSFQLRSIAPGVESRMAKMSLAGVTYPAGGVAFGDVHKARDPGRLFLAEGMADTLALQVAGVRAIGAPGTESLKHLAGFLGDVAGRTIILCPQNDADRIEKRNAERAARGEKVHDSLSSEAAFRALADTLHLGGATVLTLSTPEPHKDPSDWLKYMGRDQFKAALDAVQPLDVEIEQLPLPGGGGGAAPNISLLPVPGAGPLPVIVNRPNEEHVTVKDSIRVLRNDDALFQRGGKLVHISRDLSEVGRDESGGRKEAPRIRILPRDVLRNRLSELARHMKLRKKDNIKIGDAPMDAVVRTIHALGSWEGIRALEGITECPVLRPDGTVVDTPGYDPDTRLVFEPSGKFLPVPPHPTGAEVASAVAFLCDEVVCDFPFAGAAHMSAWVASLLSVLGRPAIEGSVPLFALDSNTRGSGKSRLCDLVSIAATGRDMPRMPGAGNEEEWRKRIAMVALAGSPMILLDNVRRLASESLEGAITGTAIADRALGGLEMAEAEIRAVWFATGNNISLSTDLIRRTIHVRLESENERPEEREDFKHPDLLAWARTERARILQAALTILRGYVDADRPEKNLRSLGSFEAWAGLVRGAVVWAGLPDPCDTRAGLAEAADVDTALLRRLISAWEHELGEDAYSLREVCGGFESENEAARIQKSTPKHGPLYDVFAEIRPPIGGSFDVRQIGNDFRKFKGRVVDGKRLECSQDRNGISKWRVFSLASAAGSAGSAGSVSGPSQTNFSNP